MTDKSNCIVYWVKATHHTDVTKEGYVGITNLGITERLKRHEYSSKNDKHPTVFKNAIRKYGMENLEVIELLHGSRDYCEMIEFKLRPDRYIGWNITIGGRSPALGAVRSEETRRKMSASRKGIKMPEHVTEANRQRGLKQFANLEQWEHPVANKKAWALADIAYTIFKTEKNFGRRTLSKRLGVGPDSVILMIKRIKNGWVPLEDEKWLIFKDIYTEENNGAQFT